MYSQPKLYRAKTSSKLLSTCINIYISNIWYCLMDFLHPRFGNGYGVSVFNMLSTEGCSSLAVCAFLSIWLPDKQPAYPKLLGPSKLWISSSCSEICRKRTQKMSSKEGVKDQLCSLITTRSRGEKRKQRKRKRRGRLKKRGWGGEGGERERNRQVKRRYKN